MNMDVKISNKILTNTQKIIHHDQMGFITGMQRWFDIHIPSNVIHQLSGPTDRNHTIISLDAEGGFNKIQYPFMICPRDTKNGESLPQHKKAIYQKPIQSHAEWRNPKALPLRPLTRQKLPIFSMSSQYRS